MRRLTAITFCFLLMPYANVFAENVKDILIFPLDDETAGAAPDWIGEGFATAVGEQIEGKNLRVVDRDERTKLVENADLPPGGRLSRGSMIRVAQQADVDLLVMGKFSGTENNLKIAVRALDLKTFKLSGEMTANGPLSAMPQMENELAWLLISNLELERTITRKELQRRMRRVPNSAFAYFIQSFGSSNKTSQIQLLERAVELRRDFPQAHFLMGRLYFEKRDCDRALLHLAQTGTEGSMNEKHDFMRGTCYLRMDQAEQGIRILSPLVTYAQNYEALNNLGVGYLHAGDLSKALSILLDARNAARADATVSLNLSIAYLVEGDDSMARSVIEDAIRTHPKNGMLHFIRSHLLKKQGDEIRSESAANRARSLGINTDALQSEAPTTWARLIFGREY